MSQNIVEVFLIEERRIRFILNNNVWIIDIDPDEFPILFSSETKDKYIDSTKEKIKRLTSIYENYASFIYRMYENKDYYKSFNILDKDGSNLKITAKILTSDNEPSMDCVMKETINKTKETLKNVVFDIPLYILWLPPYKAEYTLVLVQYEIQRNKEILKIISNMPVDEKE
jgi:hypothetical protein